MELRNPFANLINKSSEGIKLSEANENKSYPSFYSVEYHMDSIISMINNIDNLDENQIKNIILRQYPMILNYDLFLKSDESRYQAQQLFTNKKFLEIFLNIVGLLQLNREQTVCVNKLAYDYYILNNKDEEISNLLLQISYWINNITVIKLSGILGMHGARVLSMIANSSFKDDKKIHRVNTFLIKCNISLSIQNIIDIYCILFDRFTYPFIYTMLEFKDSRMTMEQCERFDLISSAMLEMLNSLTSEDMRKILYNYAYMIKLQSVQIVRFSLKSAKYYTRILKVIEDIELDDDKLIVP